MGKLKALENLRSDLNRGDLVTLRGRDLEYSGHFQDVCGKYANFNGFNSSVLGAKAICVDLTNGSIPDKEQKATTYEVIRRAKK